MCRQVLLHKINSLPLITKTADTIKTETFCHEFNGCVYD